MATPTIPNGETQFFPIIYDGNSGGQRIGRFVPFDDASGGTIANSCIFDSASEPYLERTPSSASNRKTWTLSFWMKLGTSSADKFILSVNQATSDSGRIAIKINSTGELQISGYNAIWRKTNRTLEDTSKFYHILIACDTTESTAQNRIRFYIDGDEVTSWNTNQTVTQDADLAINVDSAHRFAEEIWGGGNHFDGYFSEINFVDGQQLTPASFGVVDSSTGRWIPAQVKPHPTTTTTFTVSVADASGNKYFIDSSQQATVTLIEGATYRFDQSDSSNAGHPLRFSTTSNGTHSSGVEFTSGVTTSGTPGSSGAYTEIIVPTGTATLYYYCSVHSGMGGTANTQDQYGTNGFRLTFSDSSNFGTDTSGNSNTFTATNLASTDLTTDSPTQNFATGTATASSGNVVPHTISEGNLTFNNPNGTSGRGFSTARSTLRLDPKSDTGYYCEVKVDTTAGGNGFGVGVTDVRVDGVQQSSSDGYFGAGNNFQLFQDSFYYREINGSGINATDASTFPAFTTGDTLGLAFKEGKLWIAKNNTWYNSGNPSTGANPLVELSNNTLYRFCLSLYGMNLSGAPKGTFNFGQKSLTYTAPTGFVALQQDNLLATAKGISGLVWTKNRDSTDSHQLYDSSRGKHKDLQSDATNAESTTTDGLQKFLAGGQQIEDDVSINTAGESFVSWNWVANGGVSSTNNDGSISSTVQANQTAGFSIVTYTGNRTSGATIGHGLSQPPEFIITKNLDASYNWIIYFKGEGANRYGYLNLTNTWVTDTTGFNNVEPTSSVFTVGSAYESNGTHNMVAYCWHSVAGYSKISSYTGNGSTDGTFVHCDFTPSFIMIKETANSNDWVIWDSARFPLNPTNNSLFANLNQGDNGSSIDLDVLSNGFKCRTTNSQINRSGGSYIFMAFAKCPFANISPATAK